jgi:hypothetical protein
MLGMSNLHPKMRRLKLALNPDVLPAARTCDSVRARDLHCRVV